MYVKTAFHTDKHSNKRNVRKKLNHNFLSMKDHMSVQASIYNKMLKSTTKFVTPEP